MREADVSVSDAGFDAMGIQELLALSREAGLVDLEELTCRGDGGTVRVELVSRYDEQRLAALDCVDEWSHVASEGDSHQYVVSFTAPSLPESLQETAADLIGTCDPAVDDRGAELSLVGPQEAISGQLSEFEDAGAAPQLRKLDGYDGPDRPLDDLTARQREVIETAWELGYYEVPREAAAEDVAAELELDPSTVSEHLQRAERNLLAHHL